jgi:cholestenol delta-isomerase
VTAPDNTTAGCIHVFFEGYFVYNNSRMPGMQDFFGQLWKEYALSDSRYMTSDPLVLCMESLTVVRMALPPCIVPTRLMLM